jgi:hypothetical protein
LSVAKPIKYVVELDREEAKVFLEDMLNPRPNPARDELIEKARQLNLEVK